ncbi:unnamed protein product, partial [Symbiodinium necroappetens]
VGSLHSVEDLLKVRPVRLMEGDLNETTLRDIFLRELSQSKRLKYDLDIYDRAREGNKGTKKINKICGFWKEGTCTRGTQNSHDDSWEVDFKGGRAYAEVFATVRDCPRVTQCMVDCVPAACDYECEEEGLELLANTGSEEDLISKPDHEAHFSGGKKLYRKLSGRVPVIGENALAHAGAAESEDEEVAPDEDLDIRTSENRVAKLPAESAEHKFTHRPKNPYYKVCQKAKMLAPHARKREGSSTVASEKFGGHVTVDHIINRDLRDVGVEGEKVALVVKDVCTNFRYAYPSSTKEAEQVYHRLLHFFRVEDEVGIIYSDYAPDLQDATFKYKVRHNTSRPY